MPRPWPVRAGPGTRKPPSVDDPANTPPVEEALRAVITVTQMLTSDSVIPAFAPPLPRLPDRGGATTGLRVADPGVRATFRARRVSRRRVSPGARAGAR